MPNRTILNHTAHYFSMQGILVAGIVLATLILAGIGLFSSPPGKLVREYMSGETPQARVTAYVRAVARGDEATTLNLWELPTLTNPDQLHALDERRRQVTSDLLAAKLNGNFTILNVEWWGTCCEPGVTKDSRDAGGARMRVQLLDEEGLPLIYVFDVFVHDLPYWGAAEDYPLRHWVVRDVYPDGQQPIFWRFVSRTTIEFMGWKPTPMP